MCNYISRNIKYGKKLVGIVEMYKHVQATYEINHMLKYLNIKEKKS